MRLTIEGNGKRRVYGGRRPASPERANAPVVRVLGVEAAFTRRSYLPEERMALRVLADTPSLLLTFLRIGHGPDPTLRGDEMVGLEMGQPVTLDWSGKRSAPRTSVNMPVLPETETSWMMSGTGSSWMDPWNDIFRE